MTAADSVVPADPAAPADRSAVTPGREQAAADRVPPTARLSDLVLSLADRHRRWVFLAVLALYLAGFNANWRLEPDSGLYLSIGRNLAEGHGYTFHGKDHKLAYPGVPLLFTGVFRAFGPGSLVPHLVVMWLTGLAALALTYRLFLLHAGRPTAVLVTLGVAISRVFYRYTFELLTDLPFLLGVMAFLVGYEAVFHRRRGSAAATTATGSAGTEDASAAAAPDGSAAAGADERGGSAGTRWFDGVLLVAGLGFAVAARPAMLALVAAAVLAAAWSLVRGRARWGHLAVVALVVGAVALFYLKDPRQQADPNAAVSSTYVEEDQLFHLQWQTLAKMAATARGNLGVVFGDALTKASFGVSVVPGLNAVLSAAIVGAGLLLVRRRPLWGAWVLATVGMVLLVPKPMDRYFLPVVPVLVYAWWTLTRAAEARLGPGRAGRVAFLLLFGFGAVPNVLGVLDFVWQQRRVPFLTHYKEGRYASAYEAAAMIERQTGPSGSAQDPRTTWVFVPTKFARALTLLSRRYCVEPDWNTKIDPACVAVYALEPTEPATPADPRKAAAEAARAAAEAAKADPDAPRRPTVRAWLAERGWAIDPGVLATVPNADPDDPRPFTLHKVVRVGQADTQPAAAANGLGAGGLVVTNRLAEGSIVGDASAPSPGTPGEGWGGGRASEDVTRREDPTPTATWWVRQRSRRTSASWRGLAQLDAEPPPQPSPGVPGEGAGGPSDPVAGRATPLVLARIHLWPSGVARCGSPS